MMADFLVRNLETGEIEKRPFFYEGPVPEKAWTNYNRAFLKLRSVKYFYPEDPMDAYHEGIAAAEDAARRLAAGLVLRNATPVTYVANAGRLALLHFHERRVLPLRRQYRAVEKMTEGIGAVGEDGLDIDNFDPTALEPSMAMREACMPGKCEAEAPLMTARELGELLPGFTNGETRIQLARSILETLFARLPKEIVRSFRAYVAAEGNFVHAASLAGISKTRYYRCWPAWIKAARKVANAALVIRH